MIKRLLYIFIISAASLTAYSQAPVLSPIMGPTSVCWSQGTLYTFSVTASGSPFTYYWAVSPSTGSIVSNPNSSVVTVDLPFPGAPGYTIACVAINGTGPSNPSTTTVTINEMPQVTFSGANIFCQGSPTSIQASPTTISASSTISYTWMPAAGLSSPFVSSPIASPSVTTTYTVLYAIASCTNSSQLTVSVIPSPTLNAVLGQTLMCESDSNTLTITGNALSYYLYGFPINPPLLFAPFTFPPGTNSLVISGSIGSCMSSVVVPLTVVSAPILGAVPGSTVMCQTAPVTVTISGNAPSYSLNSSPCGTVITLPSNLPGGLNTLTVSGGVGTCINSSTFNILVNPSPTISAAINPNEVCVNDATVQINLTINSNASTLAMGSVPCGTSVPIAKPQASGVYSYTVTGSMSITNCSADAIASLYVSPCTGISENSIHENERIIYPNPNKGSFHANVSATSELLIIDGFGRLLQKVNVNGGETVITSLPPGVYFIVLDNRRQKLIVTD